jgi:exopolyphosphatase/guanosine-5'-triphosphate,3'-diphosphate pyrophosphatase
MRVAIIDLGTNTFSLLIVDIQTSGYKILSHAKEPVKLGEGGITKGVIAPPAFQRGVNALQRLNKIIKKENVEIIKAIATSAVREASNKNEFISEIKNLTGIEVDIISGDEEADIIYQGNNMAVNMGDEACLIMDIGGGSNEFIIANNTTIFWKQSFKLGVARLLEIFNPENPIQEHTLQRINSYLKTELQSFITEVQKHPVKRLVGSAGVFESVLHMIGKEDIVTNKTSYDIDIKDYFTISRKTIHSTAEERVAMKGLIPMRREMIVLSFILIDFILENSQVKNISLSTYSLKEGAITLFMK